MCSAKEQKAGQLDFIQVAEEKLLGFEVRDCDEMNV